jgi:hypothetical protein
VAGSNDQPRGAADNGSPGKTLCEETGDRSKCVEVFDPESDDVLTDDEKDQRADRRDTGETNKGGDAVFGPPSLIAAQKSGLFLVWSHDLDSFTEWLKTTH